MREISGCGKADHGCPCRTGLSRPAAVIIEWGGGFQMAASGQVILVVDDHNDTAELIAEMLRMEGFTSFATASVLEAVNLYERSRPALVITDSILPAAPRDQICCACCGVSTATPWGARSSSLDCPMRSRSSRRTSCWRSRWTSIDSLQWFALYSGGPPAARQAQR